MIEQRGLARVAYDSQRNVTRREWFLQELDRAIRLATLQSLAAPHSTKPGRSCRPLPLEVIRRIYCLQQWFDLSDPQAEEMRSDRESMRCFARVELGEDPVPDASTIVQRHHLLEARQLTAQMFDAVRDLLGDRDLLVTTGTIIDATWTRRRAR
jgi:IS5 family transposase